MALINIALDTSVCVDLLRGKTNPEARIGTRNRTLMCAVALGEISIGFKNSGAWGQNTQKLEEFLQDLDIEIVSITQRTANHYALIWQWLNDQGTPLPTNDIWIAASAMEHGVPLATNDRHFKKIPHIVLI